GKRGKRVGEKGHSYLFTKTIRNDPCPPPDFHQRRQRIVMGIPTGSLSVVHGPATTTMLQLLLLGPRPRGGRGPNFFLKICRQPAEFRERENVLALQVGREIICRVRFHQHVNRLPSRQGRPYLHGEDGRADVSPGAEND